MAVYSRRTPNVHGDRRYQREYLFIVHNIKWIGRWEKMYTNQLFKHLFF